MYLYTDVETSGFVNRRLPLNDPKQPFVVQFAAVLTDSAFNEIESCGLIIDPGSRVIPDETAKIHGITTEIAKSYGVPLSAVMALWDSFVSKATVIIGHNIDFDLEMMEISAYQNGRSPVKIAQQKFCTMKASTDILKIPPTPKMVAAGINRHKSPNLAECVGFFCERNHDGAHGAMADTRACIEIHQAILKRQSEELVF